MADKITQLVNKAGDNLYPLSGGTLSDSITTDMIKDGAVTSDKIDWTTIEDTTQLTLLNSYTGSATVKNVHGRVVFSMAVGGVGTSQTNICTIPESIRPSRNMPVNVLGQRTDNWRWEAFQCVILSSDGSVVPLNAPTNIQTSVGTAIWDL